MDKIKLNQVLKINIQIAMGIFVVLTVDVGEKPLPRAYCQISLYEKKNRNT